MTELTQYRQKLEHFVESEYNTLRRKAGIAMLGFPGALTLQPTAVVNEAILKLLKATNRDKLQSRCGFMLAISRAIRDVLIDNLRRRTSKKRGENRPLTLESAEFEDQKSRRELVDLKEAVESLRQTTSRQAEVIEMRFFGGFSVREIADGLRVSVATVERDIVKARGTLYSMLAE